MLQTRLRRSKPIRVDPVDAQTERLAARRHCRITPAVVVPRRGGETARDARCYPNTFRSSSKSVASALGHARPKVRYAVVAAGDIADRDPERTRRKGWRTCALSKAWSAHCRRASGLLEPFERSVRIDPTARTETLSAVETPADVAASLLRDTGRSRCMVVDSLRAADIMPILMSNILAEAIVMTDTAGQHRGLGDISPATGLPGMALASMSTWFNPTIHTNTVEDAFSLFKRGMRGIDQHCGKQHLHRYVTKFVSRYTNPFRTNGCVPGLSRLSASMSATRDRGSDSRCW